MTPKPAESAVERYYALEWVPDGEMGFDPGGREVKDAADAAIAELKAEVERLKHLHSALQDEAAALLYRSEDAEAEVERLKCCGNCKHLVTDTVQTRTIRIWAQVVLPRACTLQCGECDSDVTAWGRCMFTPSRWQRRES